SATLGEATVSKHEIEYFVTKAAKDAADVELAHYEWDPRDYVKDADGDTEPNDPKRHARKLPKFPELAPEVSDPEHYDSKAALRKHGWIERRTDDNNVTLFRHVVHRGSILTDGGDFLHRLGDGVAGGRADELESYLKSFEEAQ